MQKIEINTPFIKLEQFLKYASIVSSGGEAKILIQEGLVKLNGTTEIQRGKKLVKGDKIEINDEIYEII